VKALKWIALGLGALVLIAVAVVAYLAATFDPNDYKPRIVALVKQQTGRTLTLDGKIGLTFFPRIGAALSKVTLSEPNSPTVFSRVEEARVAVALWPLLSKQVVVDRVTLKGLAVDLVRFKNGRTNFDDLTGQAAAPAKPGEAPRAKQPGTPLAFEVGGIDIVNAVIGWRDERDGTNVRLSDLNLKTGRLASGVPGKLALGTKIQGAQPKVNLQFNLDTGYRMDFETQAIALSSLEAKLSGDAQGVSGIDARVKGTAIDLDPKSQRVTISGLALTAKTKDGLDAKAAVPSLKLAPDRAESQAISAEFTLTTPPRTVRAKIQIAPLTLKGTQIQLSQLDVDLDVKQPDLSVQGKLATPVTLDLDKQQAQLPRIAGSLALSGKNIPANSKAMVSGAARADWGAQSANAELAVKLEDSSIDAKVAVAHWSTPAITFSLVADRLNVDRYFPPAKPAATPAGGPPAAPAPAGSGAPAEQPFDLSPLKTLNATGNVRIGALQVSNVKAEQVALAIKVAGGKLDVNPIGASLYGGTLAGSVAVNANDNSFVVKQKLAGVSVGPLLRDLANKDLLEGRGAVALDVTTVGTTATALRKGLAGTANAVLKDGTIKGIDIVGAITAAQALIGSKRAIEQPAKGGAQTDFTELTASFVIKNGVAHNEDLQAKSSLVKLAGRGDIDIGEGTLDYTATAVLTSAVAGLGGKDLAQLAGVPVPVRVTGPLANPKYALDVGSLATDLAKDALQRELQRRLGGDKPAGKSGRDPVGDALKGLFGKPK
jgi:AsmA protein